MKLMVIGFPKSGTTTITHALQSSGLKPVHWRMIDGERYFVGSAIYAAVYQGLDPFALLPGYDAVTQADVCIPKFNINRWPNLDFAILRAIRRAHPECLFLLNYRRPEAISESICKWVDLHDRLTVSEIPGLPAGLGGKREHLITWIENHFDACRHYFANDDHFAEIDIESAEAPELLGKALGMPITGWGVHKPVEPPPGSW